MLLIRGSFIAEMTTDIIYFLFPRNLLIYGHELFTMRRGLIIFALGVLVLFAFVSFFDYGAILGVMQSANLGYVGAAILVQIMILVLFAARLKIIASKHSGLGFSQAFKTVVVGTFVNLATPISKIGGQPAM